MIETLPWEEVAGNPDKYIQLLEEKELELQRDTFKVRQELRLVRQGPWLARPASCGSWPRTRRGSGRHWK